VDFVLCTFAIQKVENVKTYNRSSRIQQHLLLDYSFSVDFFFLPAIKCDDVRVRKSVTVSRWNVLHKNLRGTYTAWKDSNLAISGHGKLLCNLMFVCGKKRIRVNTEQYISRQTRKHHLCRHIQESVKFHVHIQLKHCWVWEVWRPFTC